MCTVCVQIDSESARPVKPNKKDMCFDALKDRILSTELAPGTTIDEASFAAEFGMSRTPLREVLQRLAGAGYLQVQENRSAKVASLDLKALRLFFQTAPMVYANVARLAAENRTEPQLTALKDAQQIFRGETRSGSPERAALANHRFHEIIAEMAENMYLRPAMDRLLIDHARLSQTFYKPASPHEARLIETALEQHDAMISAIAAQEGALAVDLTLEHWDLSRGRMDRFVRPDPLPIDLNMSKERKDAV